jgi:beta-lactam-binding protein with PASTA domain
MENTPRTTSIGKILKEYLVSKDFVKQLIIAFGAAIFLALTGITALRIVTHHGEAISVPNFVGLSLSDAQEAAKERGMTLIVIDSVYLAPGNKGSIVEQNPVVNFKVKESRKIFITIKAFSPEKTEMPDFHEISLQQAKAELENYGLKIGKLSYSAGYENVVIQQTFKGKIISPGTKLNKRERIDLLLGRGPSPYTLVANLNGLNIDEVYNKLSSVALNVGNVVFDNTVKTPADSAEAMVWKQEPDVRYSGKLEFGARINVFLTKDRIKVLTNKISEIEPLVPVEVVEEEFEENI